MSLKLLKKYLYDHYDHRPAANPGFVLENSRRYHQSASAFEIATGAPGSKIPVLRSTGWQQNCETQMLLPSKFILEF